MVHRGAILQHSVCDDLRVAFGSRQSGEMTIRAKSGGNGMPQQVCRLCYEVQNSQRSLEALGRQFARGMGVPSVLPKIGRSVKIAETMVGPGRANVALGNVHGGPAVYAPFSTLYHPETGAVLGEKRAGGGAAAVLLPPPNSLASRVCHWTSLAQSQSNQSSSMLKIIRERDAMFKFRLTVMFQELQDFPDVELDELEMELQYVMVEHVQRLAIGKPMTLGASLPGEESSSEEDEGTDNEGGEGGGGDNNNNNKVRREGKKNKEKPFIMCPIRHVRMHYMAATEEGLHEHLSKTKVPLRILVRARRGEAFATAVGNATIGLDKLAAYVSGHLDLDRRLQL